MHEVSNALTVVLGWIDRARGELDDAPSVEDALAIAASRARHARQIVRRAIGADVPDEQPTTVAAILTEAATGLDPEAKRAGVLLRTTLDPHLDGATLGGASVIVQILTNLLLNAIAVSPEHGTVMLDATADGADGVVFGVTDEGPGVPVERRANLLDSGVTTRAGGAGIGLRYAASLAREVGGSLSLVRAEPSARFELRWPRRRTSPHAPPATVRKPSTVLAGRRILVIEDDEAVFDLLDTALCGRGATVIRVADRAELTRTLAAGSVDVALFDISPIREDVLGALSAVRGACPTARLVLISGDPIEIPGLSADLGVASVRKPFEISEIVAVLTR
ncbi:sensor histidine kinase [Polyangium aurulentum]|uniref:ATP-binding response regulator n=1 Tax=Polyangium aurulentum TaxID=2567896 RepID=UPI0010AE4EB2|nr:HAMP domain-containing sensor histidine kinase [Polyangium aurulentum]UQA62637.1 hybrid sensor histidine kinase/response regulator [Polyangium aurulentum]